MTVENNPFAVEPNSRRLKPIIFMIDTSASMAGDRIAAVNAGAQEFLDDFREIIQFRKKGEIQVKIAALRFSSDVKWMYNQLIEAESFQWKDLTAYGLTNFGAACEELNSKLSGRITDPTSTCAPTIILISDGSPTDQWIPALEKLKGNIWFKEACKIAIAVGQGADENFLGDFIGDLDSVIRVYNGKQLEKIIYAACAMAVRGINMIQPLIDYIQDDPSLIGVDMGISTENAWKDDWFECGL